VSAQRNLIPTPRLPAKVMGETVWNTRGANSNESRTKFAPTANRADASRRQNKSMLATAAPPTIQKGRWLSAAGLMVSLPLAEKRPIEAEPHGRSRTGASRTRRGHTSKLTALSLNAAVPPCARTPDCQACVAPSQTLGDQSEPRSSSTTAYAAAPGMTCGAGPRNDCPATCKPKDTPRCDRALAPTSGWGSWLEGLDVKEGDSDGASALGPWLGIAAVSDEPELRRVAVGSSVIAMINARASVASGQLSARTRRAEGFASAAVKVTSPMTAPPGAAEKRAVMCRSPLSCTKRTRGARAATRAMSSLRLAHAELASTSSRAALVGAVVSSAVAWRGALAHANPPKRSDASLEATGDIHG